MWHTWQLCISRAWRPTVRAWPMQVIDLANVEILYIFDNYSADRIWSTRQTEFARQARIPAQICDNYSDVVPLHIYPNHPDSNDPIITHNGAHPPMGRPQWYISNVSIIFYCSMLLYYPFWMFMGFILHFYIIFGTNLLTGGPARIVGFFAYFSVSKKRNIRRSPNEIKPSGAIFLEQT